MRPQAAAGLVPIPPASPGKRDDGRQSRQIGRTASPWAPVTTTTVSHPPSSAADYRAADQRLAAQLRAAWGCPMRDAGRRQDDCTAAYWVNGTCYPPAPTIDRPAGGGFENPDLRQRSWVSVPSPAPGAAPGSCRARPPWPALQVHVRPAAWRKQQKNRFDRLFGRRIQHTAVRQAQRHLRRNQIIQPRVRQTRHLVKMSSPAIRAPRAFRRMVCSVSPGAPRQSPQQPTGDILARKRQSSQMMIRFGLSSC